MFDDDTPSVNRTTTGAPVTDGGNRVEPEITDVRRNGDEPPDTPDVRQLETLGSKSNRQSPPPRVSVLRALLRNAGEQRPRDVASRVDGLKGVLATDVVAADEDGAALMSVLLEDSVDAEAIAERLNRLDTTAGTTSATFVIDGAGGSGQREPTGDGPDGSGESTPRTDDGGVDVPEEFDLPPIDGVGADTSDDGDQSGVGDAEPVSTDPPQPDVKRPQSREERSKPVVEALQQAVSARVRQRGEDVESVDADALAEALAGVLVETDTLDSFVQSSTPSQSADVEETLENLNRRLSALESTVDGLAERSTVQPETVEQLRRQLRDHGQTLSDVEEAVDVQEGTLAAHEETIADQDAAVDRLSDAVDRQDERLAGLDEELRTLTEDVAGDGAVEELRETVADVEDAIEERRETVEGLEDDVGSLERRVTSVEATASDLGTDLSDVADDTDSLEETVAGLDDDLDDLDDSLATVEDRIDDHEAVVEDRIEELEVTLEDHERTLTEHDDAHAELEAAIEERDERLDAHERELGDLEDGVHALDDRIGEFDDRLTSHEQSLASLVERHEAAMGRVDEATAAVDRLEEIEDEFDELRESIKASGPLRERVASVDESLSALEDELTAERERIDELADAVDDLRAWQRSLQMVSGGTADDHVDVNGTNARRADEGDDDGDDGDDDHDGDVEAEADATDAAPAVEEADGQDSNAPLADRGGAQATGTRDDEEATDGDRSGTR